ncbi:RhuM family protein [Salinarimonas chemoclinalis]|uniref:RhuM family protein n=1 Tax=Salinarimonas chemoclinalis TaxID=3241599 RepID=UPI003556DAC1
MHDEPDNAIRLTEDAETGDRFLVYGTENGLRLDIRFTGETLWMTQAQIAALFARDVSSISRHIANVFKEGELEEEGSLQKVQTTSGKVTTIYSLDMVISVGYRVSSAQATAFRRWATSVLVQFAKAGFVIDKPRLRAPESSDRIAELKEIIRDIRSDEANVYRELKRICSLCQDYDGSTEAARTFYQRTQAKLIYAVASQTPSELVSDRANSDVPNMGLQTWPAENIRKKDIFVSKNYLFENELKELNRLTTILLDIFEDQLDLGRIVVMSDASQLLDDQLKRLGRSVLRSGGSVSAGDAKAVAERHYEAFHAQRTLARRRAADRDIAALASEARSVRSPKKG